MKSNPFIFSVLIISALISLHLKANAQSIVVQNAVSSDVSIPLRDMKPATKPFWERWKRENEMEVPNKFRPIHPGFTPDAAIQGVYNKILQAGSFAPIVNFEGTNNSANIGRVTPPDPTGDIGPNHYVQVVNSMLQIFDKNGTSLYGPVQTSTLWSGFSGNWDGHNNGDGIVLYDENADRWIISQFAIDCPGNPKTEYEMIAVSTTGDPTGSYYRYAFQFDYMPDYPKIGVWQDGYYMSVNRFNTNTNSYFAGVGACVLERSKMLVGDAGARMIYFKTETLGGSGSAAGINCWSMLPSDCDGTFPASGTPNYFVYDDQPTSELRLWALHPDWTTTSNSTFTFITSLPVTPFTELGSVTQPGSLALDGLGDRLMFRNQYRNFGNYETFVTCRSVNSGSGIAGIRWYEYRKTGSSFSLYQQSTYSPDAKSRWMGSIAMNASGDIGLAYSGTSSSVYPSIYYTGRKASDPLNQMTVAEGTIQTGTVSMTTYSRWGDYSAINVDPSNNTIFWTTQEYVGTYGGWCPWATKITSFKISNSPGVASLAANAVATTTATLNGIINPNGLAATYHFEYGTTSGYGMNTPTLSGGSGSSNVAVTSNISGITAGKVYHFRLVAVNNDGTSYGNDLTFTTLGGAEISTTAVTAIALTTASSGGNITSDGGYNITARGVCWATTSDPVATGNHTTNGTGTGLFTSSITGLLPGTLYHVRAYATNSNGTFYGNDLSFTTLGVITVTTTIPTGITQNTAISGGTATTDGGYAITARGVCWGTTANPLISDSHTTNGSGSGLFVSSLTGLLSNTLYHVRAYASTTTTTIYGNDLTFNTLCPAVGTLAEGFENSDFPPTCWSLNAVSGTFNWTKSTAASGYGAGTAAAFACFFQQPSGTYELKSIPLNISGIANPILKFNYAYATYMSEVDEMDVYSSSDNGSTFTLLLAMPGGPSGILNTGGTVTSPFVPSSSQWATKSIPLSAGTNMIKFKAISAFGNNLYLDDVQVSEAIAHDVSALTVDIANVHTTGSFAPQSTVKNFGSNTETFQVTITIGTYSSTKTVSSLAPNTEQQVTFDPWTATVGNYSVQVCTQLTGDLNNSNDCKSQPLKILNLNKKVYAYNAYSGTGTDPVGPTTFNLSTPAILNSLADQSSLPFIAGGTWVAGLWYGTVSNGDFITLNTTTGSRTVIGTSPVVLNGLSYNTVNGTMYGVNFDGASSNLYSINLTNGATTLIGTCGPVLLINLAINNSGVAYSVDIISDVLGTVNLVTGAFTPVGPIGFDATYAQDMEFDRESGELYMAAFTVSASGFLAWINQTTGMALKIGDFEGNADITGLAIPYTPCSAPTTQASAFTSSSITNSSMSTGWTRGNGNSVLVVARAGSAVNSDPVDGIAYNADAAFGNGTQIGTGNYVVYKGTGTLVNLTNLNGGTGYFYAIYEFSSGNCYKKPALIGNATTLCADQSQEVVNYGFYFDSSVDRWQEFKCTSSVLTSIDAYLYVQGLQGDLTATITDQADNIITARTIIEKDVQIANGWVNFSFSSPAILNAGDIYRIKITGSKPASGSNKYVWMGSTSSSYDPECLNDVSDSWPTYDYAFRTHGCSLGTTPLITTSLVSLIKPKTAVCGGVVVSEGLSSVITRGVCWSTTPYPTIGLLTKTSDGSGAGSFTSNLTGLTAGFTYFVRAYAINSEGTSYGNQVSFTYDPSLLAHYPLISNSSDATGNYPDMTLINTQFSYGGLYSNGIYIVDNSEGSNAYTPQVAQISYEKLTFQAEFMVKEYTSIRNNPVIVAGAGGHDRWLGFAILPDGHFSLNGDNFTEFSVSTNTCTLNEWHTAAITYNNSNTTGKLFIDDVLVCEAVFTFNRQYANKSIGITNYSNGSTFKGYLRNLKIFNEIHDPTLPNLRVNGFTAPTDNGTGDIIGDKIHLLITNLGKSVTQTFSVGFYVSADSMITTDDNLLIGGREGASSIDKGAVIEIPLYAGASVPGTLNNGKYYLGVLLDENNNITESNKADNYYSLPFTITGHNNPHFVPVWWPGNGMDHMNFYAQTAKLDNVDLQPGDEIGIFDGNVCVGMGTLTQVLGGSVYLSMVASKDDSDTPAKDGYTIGNNVTYRVWDSSAGNEVINAIATYTSGVGIFSPGSTSSFNLNAFNTITQNISLTAGWNIMSFAGEPDNMSLMTIVTPLKNAGTLQKIQDQKGNAIEQLPAPIGWVDNIGLMKVSEGYKIKVSANSTLSIIGKPITLPYNIALAAGWNIMGYPSMNSQAAMAAFQLLIDAGTLLKVQDEKGNAIEKLPAPIGWVDNIHNLLPGEGYKAKTSANTTLTINNSGKGEYQNIEAELIMSPTHFKPVFKGNGLDQMNIYVQSPTIDGLALKAGDEIGVFDGGRCVGAVVIDDPNLGYYSIIASVDDPTTKDADGFTEGNAFDLKLWNAQTGSEGKVQRTEYQKGYSKYFEKLGTSVLTVDFTKESINVLGDAFPNPSSEKTTFTFQLAMESQVQLGIYDITGNLIKLLIDKKMPGGTHKIEWDNRSANGTKTSSGIYFYRLKLNDFLVSKRLAIN